MSLEPFERFCQNLSDFQQDMTKRCASNTHSASIINTGKTSAFKYVEIIDGKANFHISDEYPTIHQSKEQLERYAEECSKRNEGTNLE